MRRSVRSSARSTRSAAPLVVAALIVSCAFGELAVPVDESVGRPPPDVGCASWAAGQPLRGTLQVESVDSVAETRVVDGPNSYHVVWPAGFKARPDENGNLVLIDDQGNELFANGDEIELPQVDVRTHAGTAEDPFVASGLYANQCWVPPPDQFAG